jgi:hypothetical protein
MLVFIIALINHGSISVIYSTVWYPEQHKFGIACNYELRLKVKTPEDLGMLSRIYVVQGTTQCYITLMDYQGNNKYQDSK